MKLFVNFLVVLMLFTATPVVAQECEQTSCPVHVEEDMDPGDYESTSDLDIAFEELEVLDEADVLLSIENVYERYVLPEGRRCTVDGETFQCFNLGEYKLLLEMDYNLRYLEPAYANALARIEVYKRIVTNLMVALDAANEQIDTLQIERDRLYNQWSDENRKRFEVENRPVLGNWLPWSIAAGEGVVIITLLLALVFGG
jgi:hypothetical protein